MELTIATGLDPNKDALHRYNGLMRDRTVLKLYFWTNDYHWIELLLEHGWTGFKVTNWTENKEWLITQRLKGD
jgi:hypothetical protein